MRRESKISFLVIAILCGLVLWAAPAEARLITIEIEAEVDSVWDEGNYLEEKIGPGDMIRGFYVYESTTPDSSRLDPVQGNYWHYAPPAGIALTLGGFNFMTDPFNIAFAVAIRNDIPPGGGDVYSVGSSNNLPLSNGTPVERIWWQVNDNTGSALSSDALPTTFPLLDDWQANVLSLESDRAFIIHAYVTSVIPEPCTILLFGLGTMLLRKRR